MRRHRVAIALALLVVVGVICGLVAWPMVASGGHGTGTVVHNVVSFASDDD